jgi:hypothetical protein
MLIATEAVQLHGGCGYCTDYRVERLVCGARILQIWEATNRIQHQRIGRSFIDKRCETNRLFYARRGELLAEGGGGARRRERVLIQIEPEVERHQDLVVIAPVLF